MKKINKLTYAIIALILCLSIPFGAMASSNHEECTAKILQAGDFDINYDRDYSKYVKKNPFGVSTYDVNMNDVERRLEERIYQGLLEGWSSINFYLNEGLSREWAMTMYSDVINDHPELFYVSHNYGVEYTFSTITTIIPHYTMSRSEIESAKVVFNNGVNKALSQVDNSMDDMQKALVIHDYICSNATYAEDGDISHSAWGFFKNGRIVCAGYALTYSYLMNKLGVQCEMVTSISMNHGWNTIKINGHYYNVDCTWDDAGASPYGHKPDGRVNHGCFLKSNSHASFSSRSGVDTFDDCERTDKSYDSMFWDDIKTNIPVIDGKYYYMKPDFKLYVTYLTERTKSGSERSLGRFYAEPNATTNTSFLYSYLTLLNGYIYVSAGQKMNSKPFMIYAVNPRTSQQYEICRLNNIAVAGLGVENGNIIYQYKDQDSTFNTVGRIEPFRNNITTIRGGYNPYADINNDGYVNAKDYVIITR